MSSGSGTRRTAGRSRSDAQSWTDPRWPGRKRARRSRRSITSATRSGGSAKRSPDVPRLRAVLFDIDGTLLDTRDAWVAAFDAGLAAIRKTSISGAEAAQWIGTPIEVIYAERCAVVGDELARAVREFQRIEAESVRDGMRAYPGVREAIASLVAWKLAAVTNKRRDTSIEALRVSGLLPFFALVLGGDSVPHKKPAPDPILRAASALGVRPAECAVVGDTENDVVAGKAAGARTIGVTWGYGTRARLEADVDDHRVDVEDRLLQRPVVVYDGALDLPVPFEARDLGVEEHLDRAFHHGFDVLLHRPELFAAVDEDHFLRGRDDFERDLEGAVSAADDDHPFPLELAAVPHAVLDAFRLEFRLARHVQAFRLEQPHPHREDDRSAFVDVALTGRELEAGCLSLDIHDFLGPDLGTALP